MSDPRTPFWNELRRLNGGKIPTALFNDVNAALNKHRVPAMHPEPRWMVEARARIGEKEVPGPKHNSWISEGWGRLGAGWFNDDETPWCGFFVAHCIEFAKLPYPALFPRARSWASWGKKCLPQVGAVVVFERGSGGHVGFLVGENATNYYVLGGNQSNAVNITPISKLRALTDGVRWPAGVPEAGIQLPRMTGGTVSTNEA
jgi:uncharacterized protein (TIGR02594 family)